MVASHLKQLLNGMETTKFLVILIAVLVICIYIYALYVDRNKDIHQVTSKLSLKDYTFVVSKGKKSNFDTAPLLFRQCYNVHGTIKTTWAHESIYDHKGVRLEYWRDEKATRHGSDCTWPDGFTTYLVQTVTKRTTNIAFIGDSLSRNLANSFIDILRPSSAFRMNPVMMIKGHTHRSMIQYPLSTKHHFHGWNDGVISLTEYGIHIHMVWRPWYPPSDMLDPNCVDQHRFSKCFKYRRAAIQKRYLNAWLDRGAPTLQGDIEALPKDSILIFGYPVTSTKPSADMWMGNQLPKILSSLKDRAVFVSHLKDPRVTALLERLGSRDVQFEWYGDDDTAPAELWYDKWHIWGPVQELASKNLLILMSRILNS